MKVYKILHKPTGLYFIPSRGHGNFSINGKIYPNRPSLKVCIGGGARIEIKTWGDKKLNPLQEKLVDFFNLQSYCLRGSYWIDKSVNTPYEDWEIVEIEDKISEVTQNITLKDRPLSEWRIWIEEELRPSTVAKPEVLYTLEAFLELINIVESKK